MMDTAIIIQARTGSTRMPQKVIRDFYNGQSIIEILLSKLQKIGLPIILATTTHKADDVLVDIAKRFNTYTFRGSETNVISRFIQAGEIHHVKYIIRVCADNPFLDISSINQLIKEFNKSNPEYLSFLFSKNRPSLKTHFGFYAELTTLETLKKVASLTSEKTYIEHVTNYIYSHPEIFDVRFIQSPYEIFHRNDIRLTLDTHEDFSLQQKIYSELIAQNPNFGIEEILKFLENNPVYLDLMKAEIEKNSK